MKQVAYWVATALLAVGLLGGASYDIRQTEDIAQTMTRLGYPLYVCTILGVWKLGAAVVILLPGLPRLKEWAYAGIAFNLTGALASHLFVRDPAGALVSPFVLLVLAVASWGLRPAGRRLPGPWV